MASTVQIDRPTFAGGELGEALAARADLAKYQISVEKMENYVVMVEGGATRRPGTRFVLELKNETQQGRFIPFRRSSTDYYMLVINAGVSRFLRMGGFIENPDTTPYELTVPWIEADLPSLRAASTTNSIYVVSSSKAPQEITWAGFTSWTCAAFITQNGPVDTQNVNTGITVQASAVTGDITLTGVGNPFTAAMVGGIMRLDDRDLSLTPEWSALESSIVVNSIRRWNGQVYISTVASADAGPNAPTHSEGAVSAGHGFQTWLFLNKDYGFVRITAFTDANHVSATVLTQLPGDLVTGGTYRWYPPAWSNDLGWPDVIAFNTPRLYFFRDNLAWASANDDPHDMDTGTELDTDAIVERILAPDASLVDIEWALPSGVLLLGTSDLEWSLRGANLFDALTPTNFRAIPETSDGSIAQVAVLVDGGAMHVGKTGKRLHYAKYNRQTQVLESQELSVTARHIFDAGVARIAWQRDPNRVLWMAMNDGTLASFTFMPEQQVAAFCRHPMQNAFVEDVAAIPGVASGSDEVYLIVRRTINGVVRRYCEILSDYFEVEDPNEPTAAGAWFVDCGLNITGSGMTKITQLAHLEGQEVAVFADAAMQTRKTVVNGTITLDRPSSNVTVGLPIKGYLRDLPRNINTQGGSTAGRKKNIHEALVQVKDTGGGQVRVYNAEEDIPELWENIIETGTSNYGGPLALVSKRKPVTVEGDVDFEARLEFQCDDAMPSTILLLSPRVDIEEDG
jgi:hypothetical protein